MNAKKLAYGAYMYPTMLAQKYEQVGSNALGKDWDVLFASDACRVDTIEEVPQEHDFIESVDSICSVGSTSKSGIFTHSI